MTFNNYSTKARWISVGYNHLIYPTSASGILVTRDDVVSQRLKFGSAFLSYFSWESNIALFF